MKVLITGAAGSTGSIAAEMLVIGYGAEVVGIDNMFNGDMRNLDMVMHDKKFQFIEMDILDKNRLLGLFEEHKFTHVIHAAAWVHTDHFYNSVYDVYKNNVEGTENVLSIAYIYGVKRVLNCSTSEAYGHMEKFPGSPHDRSTFDSPMQSKRWSYAVGKLMGEHLGIAYGEKAGGMDVVSMRYGNIYGHRDLNSTHLVPWVIKSAIETGAVTLTAGSKERMRSFVHATDAASATVLALLKGHNGKIYACGGTEEDTVYEIAKRITRLMGMEEVPILVGETVRPGDPDRRILDTSELEQDTGWVRAYDLDKGLYDVISAYRDEHDRT